MAASMRSCVLQRLQNIGRFTRSSRYFKNSKQFSVIRIGKDTIPIYEVKHPHLHARSLFTTARCYNTEDTQEAEVEEDYHSIIKDTERSKGPSDKHEFQAETRKLLDIVARSLYSEKEVFIRELISNASDALEKLRYIQVTKQEAITDDLSLEIHIATDEEKKTLTIQDTGVGMTKEEIIENLGTIARSGSKAFLENVDQGSSDVASNIIGQFGVGFYSSFMVASKVEVYSKTYHPDSPAYKWSSDGTGSYELSEAEAVDRGTKIVLHLKGDCYDYAKENIVNDVIKKYSNFLGVPIFLNGRRANIVQALWMMDQKDITEDMHHEFYRFTTNLYDSPKYHLQYKIDAPLNIRALFYVPDHKPTFDLSRESDVGIALYCRKIMIMSKANNVLPRWLRFVKGVVDSEDIPLNLSRELLQDSALIRKLRTVLTTRLLKFFQDQSKKDPEKYMKFYEDYGLFFREGIITTHEQEQKEEVAKLLRFESSKLPPGEVVSLTDYATRMKAGARNIYYLSAPSRQLAETSPYFEALQKKDIEVLFCYEPYDELVLMQLGQFDKKYLKSIENEIQESKEDTDTVDEKDPESLSQTNADELMSWLGVVLTNKVQKIKVTKRLSSHPCIITVAEMGAARHFLRTTLADKSQDERYRLLQPTLELTDYYNHWNYPSHKLIRKLFLLKESDPDLGRLLAEQLYENAMIGAGLLDDPRVMVGRLTELLERALDKI
ncbi:TNF receptor-associated protein 1 [Mytilus galloprovincialis]|uniref:Heat shock protein 75 kDa, mitochondrial n=1 Tax=Mytilus galloprovincialis TaxID=29158 RepID=A0A8B6CAW2_MYTGA|nr:TNF receptor-associated protein 1 [Mytilus galloprovincialis]